MILHRRYKPKEGEFYMEEIKFEDVSIEFSNPSNAVEMYKFQKDFYKRIFGDDAPYKKVRKTFNKYFNNLIAIATKENATILRNLKNQLFLYYSSNYINQLAFYPQKNNRDCVESKDIRILKFENFLMADTIFMNLPFNVVNIKPSELKKMINRVFDMSGRKLSAKKRKMYLEIIEIQKDLKKKHGDRSQSASLKNAVRNYSKKYKKLFEEKKIESISKSIKYQIKNDRLTS